MTSSYPGLGAAATRLHHPVLEIADPEGQTPFRLPVLVQNFSMEKVTLAVINPWIIGNWQPYQGRDCILRLPGAQNQQPISIDSKIVWTRFNVDGQSPLSLGLHMAKPPGEALRRLSAQITHSTRDIKGLWERYDQVQEVPANPNWPHYLYISGLVLLLGGVVLQLFVARPYKDFGWILWFLGSLGIAPKVLRSICQKEDFKGQRELGRIGHAD